MKTFRRAIFKTPHDEYWTISCFYAFPKYEDELAFHHLVVEHERGGSAKRFDFHPWEYKYNMRAMMRDARRTVLGKKVLHIKN